jgi:hypothetical protein
MGDGQLRKHVLAILGATGPPSAPWWQQLTEQIREPLRAAIASAIVTGGLALLAWIQRRTIGRWWAGWQERHRYLRVTPSARRHRALLLESMERTWIDGYLRAALDLDAIPHLPVRLAAAGDATGLGRPRRSLVDGLIEVWDRDQRRKLRVTGDWGTGKTIHVLLLARCLLDRAGSDLTQPVPVVLNVSTWTAREGVFDQWVLNEVTRRNRKDVDRDALRRLWEHGDLALLLDGVDEHPDPAECAEAINAMLEHHVGLSIVIAYRTDPTDPVRQQAIEQHLDGLDEVTVQPLDRKTVDRLLQEAGPEWAGVREVIGANADLWEPLICRPLLLTVVMRAFRGKPAEEIPALRGDVDDRRAQVYDAYLSETLLRRTRAGEAGAPTGEHVRQALAWLAETAARCELGTAISLEQISPCWLPDQRDRARARRLRVLASGLVAALPWAAVLFVLREANMRLAEVLSARLQVATGRVGTLALALILGLTGGLSVGVPLVLAWAAARLAAGVAVGLAIGLGFVLSFELASRTADGLGIGLVLVLAAALLGVWEVLRRHDGPVPTTGRLVWRATRLRRRWRGGLGITLGAALGIALSTALGISLRTWDVAPMGGMAAGIAVVAAQVVGVGIGLLIQAGVEGHPAALGEAPYPVLLRRHVLRNLASGWVAGFAAGLAFGTALTLAAFAVGLATGVLGLVPTAVLIVPALCLAVGLGFGLALGLVGAVARGSAAAVAGVSYRVMHRALRRAGLFPGPSTGRLPGLVCRPPRPAAPEGRLRVSVPAPDVSGAPRRGPPPRSTAHGQGGREMTARFSTPRPRAGR